MGKMKQQRNDERTKKKFPTGKPPQVRPAFSFLHPVAAPSSGRGASRTGRPTSGPRLPNPPRAAARTRRGLAATSSGCRSAPGVFHPGPPWLPIRRAPPRPVQRLRVARDQRRGRLRRPRCWSPSAAFSKDQEPHKLRGFLRGPFWPATEGRGERRGWKTKGSDWERLPWFWFRFAVLWFFCGVFPWFFIG